MRPDPSLAEICEQFEKSADYYDPRILVRDLRRWRDEYETERQLRREWQHRFEACDECDGDGTTPSTVSTDLCGEDGIELDQCAACRGTGISAWAQAERDRDAAVARADALARELAIYKREIADAAREAADAVATFDPDARVPSEEQLVLARLQGAIDGALAVVNLDVIRRAPRG